MKRHIYYFCTYFDSNYLIKGLALYRSLLRHAVPFRLWILCFDDLTHEILKRLRLPEIDLISLRDFEEGNQELLKAKSNRSRIEYYFTCTPFLPFSILRNHPEVDVITYLDADLFFFSDPYPLYQELDRGSVLLVGHRFPSHLKHLEVHGIYNVGLLSFRKDSVGQECLRWWCNRCLDWCYDQVEDGCFADQKYLDDWPVRFPGVVVLQHKGAGLAPWNVENYFLHSEKRQVLADSQPLVFFHFHELKQIRLWLYDPTLARRGLHTNYFLKKYIYGPYIRELLEVAHWISVSLPINQSQICLGSIRGRRARVEIKSNMFREMAKKIIIQFSIIKNVLQGKLWVMILGRIL